MSLNDSAFHSALAENCISSEVKVDRATLVWKIHNFDYCEGLGIDVLSPTFSASTNDKVKWFIKLKPNGVTDEKDTIALHLFLSDSSEQKLVMAKFSFCILNDEVEKIFSRTTKTFATFHIDVKSNWGWEHFCPKDADFREKLLSDNVLQIYCEVIFPQKSDIFEHRHYRNARFLKSAEAICDSTNILDILLKTHLLSDVVISVKGKDYPAHKAILAARSKVFAAMFQHDTKENQHNLIEIKDMSESAVDEMLKFIYVGKCGENLDELATELFVAADKYDLDLLKIMSSQALCRNLSVENAAQNFIFADLHNATELKGEVMKFIVAKAAEVFDTPDWKNISGDQRLIEEVIRAMARR